MGIPPHAPAGADEGLGLDRQGAASPKLLKKRVISPLGLADDAQGMEAAWPGQAQTDPVHDSPTPNGVCQYSALVGSIVISCLQEIER
jgi:hypothetical protein